MKKLLIVFIILALLTGCGETSEKPESDTAGKLYQIPNEVINGKEKADFDRFNSYASENGLGGTPVYIEGKFESVSDMSSDDYVLFFTEFKDTDNHSWIIQLDVDVLGSKEKFEKHYYHDVVISGYYTGYSKLYNMPVLQCEQIFDRETKDITYSMFSLFFPNNKGGNEESDFYGTWITDSIIVDGHLYSADEYEQTGDSIKDAYLIIGEEEKGYLYIATSDTCAEGNLTFNEDNTFLGGMELYIHNNYLFAINWNDLSNIMLYKRYSNSQDITDVSGKGTQNENNTNNNEPNTGTNENNTEEEGKYIINLSIDFIENFFFNKYDVTVSVDDKEVLKMKHGSDSDLSFKINEGNHTITFVSDEDKEIKSVLELPAVESDIDISLRITCNTDNIKIDRTEIDRKVVLEEDEVKIDFDSEELKNKSYPDIENVFKNIGFTNIKAYAQTTESSYKDKELISVSINGQKEFHKHEIYKKDSEIVIFYYLYEECPFEYCAEYDTENRNSEYILYYLIDTDDKVAYYFANTDKKAFKGTLSGNSTDGFTIDFEEYKIYLSFFGGEVTVKTEDGYTVKYERVSPKGIWKRYKSIISNTD